MRFLLSLTVLLLGLGGAACSNGERDSHTTGNDVQEALAKPLVEAEQVEEVLQNAADSRAAEVD